MTKQPLKQTQRNGQAHPFAGVAAAGLGKHRVGFELQRLGDFLAGKTLTDQPDNLLLAGTQGLAPPEGAYGKINTLVKGAMLVEGSRRYGALPIQVVNAAEGKPRVRDWDCTICSHYRYKV